MGDNPAVLIVGAGAIGAVVGCALSKQGSQVSVTCRSDFDAVRRNGYLIQGAHETVQFKPANVLRDAGEFAGTAAYVVLCVKVTADIDRVALLRPAVHSGACIVLIENGIDIEAPIATAFPQNELASAIAYAGVSRVQPGKIIATMNAQLALGGYPHSPGDATRKFAAMCTAGGLPARVTQNLQSARWQKAVWNAVFNPVSVLAGAADTKAMLNSSGGERFIRAAMHEVAAVAAASGFPLSPDVVDQTIHATKGLPAYKTSMAIDFENGRPMETEAILGNVMHIARKLNVATPSLDVIYGLMKMVESSR
jgi:2-dehydropantoate 2-reductase